MDKYTLDTKKSSFIQKQTGNFGLWCNLGDDYLKSDDIISAIECYEKALEFDSNIIEVYLNIGVAYNKIGDEPKAIEYFRKSVDIQPQYGNGWYNLGYSYSLLSDMERAFFCYEKAINSSISPADGAFCTIGYEFLKQNDLDNAYKSLILGMAKVSSLKKNDLMAMFLLNLGHIYFLKGNFESAREKYHSSMNCYGNLTIFNKHAEEDIPDLIKIGLDLNKWRDLINSTKNAKKFNLEKFANKVVIFVQNNIEQINAYLEENKERVIFYVDKENPLIGWRFKDAYKNYLNGSEEWEVVGFNLNKQLNKLVSFEEDLILTPVFDDESMSGNKKTERPIVFPNDDGSLENMSPKKWWKFWE